MLAVFVRMNAGLGFPLGYLLSFVIYWLGFCALVPALILGGWRRTLELFADQSGRGGRLEWQDKLLLAWPPIAAAVFAFVPRVALLSMSVVVVSIALGVITGVTEEVLWRGLYVRLFPRSFLLSSLYPSIGFALWHLAPLAVRPSRHPGGSIAFVCYALALGLSYARVARRTGSIRSCVLSHCLHDGLGLGGLAYSEWLNGAVS